MLQPFLLSGSETLTWYEYNESWVRDVGVNFWRPAFAIRSIGRLRKVAVQNLRHMEKNLDEIVKEGVCFGVML